MIVTLLLAAGSSSRMRGGDKLLEEVDGEPLLRRQAAMAANLGPTFVVMDAARPDRVATIEDLPVTPVFISDPSQGMGSSIAAGVAALPVDAIAVLILPADMPDIGGGDLDTFHHQFEAHADLLFQGVTEDGRTGHPVLFPRRCFTALKTLSGDQGARSILQGEAPIPILVPGAATDLDTPEDWARWRTARDNSQDRTSI